MNPGETIQNDLGPACLDPEPASAVPAVTEDRTGPVTVGEVRAFLARYGIPHADDTHYAIVATTGDAAGRMAIMNCCDDAGHAAALLGEALENLTGDGRALAEGSPGVIVSREDLRALLAYARGVDINVELAVGRLSAAAGLGES